MLAILYYANLDFKKLRKNLLQLRQNHFPRFFRIFENASFTYFVICRAIKWVYIF